MIKPTIILGICLMMIFGSTAPAVAERFIVDPDNASITISADPNGDYSEICQLGTGDETLNNATWDDFRTQVGDTGVWSGSVCNESLLNVTSEATEVNTWSSNIMAWDTEQIMSGASEGWVRSPFNISEELQDNNGEMQFDIYNIDSKNTTLVDRPMNQIDYSITDYRDFNKYEIKSSNIATDWDNPWHSGLDIYKQYDYNSDNVILRETFNNIDEGFYDGVNVAGSHGEVWTANELSIYNISYKTLHNNRWRSARFIHSDATTKGISWTGNEVLGDDSTYDENETSLSFFASFTSTSDMCFLTRHVLTDTYAGSWNFYTAYHGSRTKCTSLGYPASDIWAVTPIDTLVDYADDSNSWRGYDINILDIFHSLYGSGTIPNWNGSQTYTFQFVSQTDVPDSAKLWKLDDITLSKDETSLPTLSEASIELLFKSDYLMEFDTDPGDRITWSVGNTLKVYSKIDQYYAEYTASNNWNPTYAPRGTVFNLKFTFTSALGMSNLYFSLEEMATKVPSLSSHPRLVFRQYINMTDYLNGDDHISNFEIINSRSYHRFDAPIFSKPSQYLFVFNINGRAPSTHVYFGVQDDGNDDFNQSYINVNDQEYYVDGQYSFGISTLLVQGMSNGINGYKITLEQNQIMIMDDILQDTEFANNGEYLNYVFAFWNHTQDVDINFKAYSNDNNWYAGWVLKELASYVVLPVLYWGASASNDFTLIIRNPNEDAITFYIWGISESESSFSQDSKFQVGKYGLDTDTDNHFNSIKFRPWHSLQISNDYWSQVLIPQPSIVWDINVDKDFLEKVEFQSSSGTNIWSMIGDKLLSYAIDFAEFLTNNELTRWISNRVNEFLEGLNYVKDFILNGLNTAWNWVKKIGTSLFMIFKNIASITMKIIDFVLNIFVNFMLPLVVFVSVIVLVDKFLGVFSARDGDDMSNRIEAFFGKIFAPFRGRR